MLLGVFIAIFAALPLNGAVSEPISVVEAKAFLEPRYLRTFPSSAGLKEKNIRAIEHLGVLNICYFEECWPVKRDGGKIIDLAFQAAESLVPAMVEFRFVTARKTEAGQYVQVFLQRNFALEMTSSQSLVDVLRWLDGYSEFNSYHVNLAPKAEVPATDPSWIKAFYYSEDRWNISREMLVQYEPIGFLEELYDCDLGLILRLPGESLRKDPLYNGKFVIKSPWAISAFEITKDGRSISDKVKKHFLPLGPSTKKKALLEE
jgi:hypothetical protein